MRVYHEVSSNSFASVQSQGLKRTNRGAKGQDKLIIQTDEFLDSHRPKNLIKNDLRRCNNLYGYLGTKEVIVDIRDGKIKPIKNWRSDHTLLQLTIDPTRCWIADLDRYDAIKNGVSEGVNSALVHLALDYWENTTRLDLYQWKSIQRPEVMITYNLPPTLIQLVGSSYKK